MRQTTVGFGMVVLAAAMVPGCTAITDLLNGGDDGTTERSSQLKAFTSQSELEAYFKSQIGERNSQFSGLIRDEALGGAPEAPLADGDAGNSEAVSAPSPAPGDSFSGTTTQESGVDEADVVKTDGTYFYMIDSNYEGEGSVLRIVRANPADQLGVVSETAVDGYGRDLYLRGNKLVAITTGGGFYFYPLIDFAAAQDIDAMPPETGMMTDGGDAGVSSEDTVASEPVDVISIAPIGGDDFVYERPHTLVTVYDIADTASPVMLSQTKFDGTQSATRMIDGVLHMVTANYQSYFFDVMPMLGRPELDVAAVDVRTLLPTFERTNADGSKTAGSVVNWDSLYYPAEEDGFGVATLVSLDVDHDAAFSAVGVVAEPGLIYASLNALYLTNTQWDWQGTARTTTNVYKFAFEDRGARPVATGSVDGRILNQYSMGEHQGNLRVATTIDAVFTCGLFECTRTEEAHNNVHVLGQSGDSLAVLGSVTGIAPRETIQSARFIGDKGYVVTFEQTDPLFTLDLSDPTNPRVVGELEVPGFSTFLTPIDEHHLLAVGQYVPAPGSNGAWGVQVSIFDVTDFANPTRSANVILGETTGAYSEAVWDPKAFTYFAEGGMVGLPLNIYPTWVFSGSEGGTTDGGAAVDGSTGVEGIAVDEPTSTDDFTPVQVDEGFDGLVVFSASAAGGLAELGRMSTRFAETPYWGTSFTRGVFIGDKVYAVSNLGVRESAASAVSTPEHELFYGPVFEEAPVEIKPEPVPVDDTEVVDPVVVGDAPSSDAGAGTTRSSGSGAATGGQ